MGSETYTFGDENVYVLTAKRIRLGLRGFRLRRGASAAVSAYGRTWATKHCQAGGASPSLRAASGLMNLALYPQPAVVTRLRIGRGNPSPDSSVCQLGRGEGLPQAPLTKEEKGRSQLSACSWLREGYSSASLTDIPHARDGCPSAR